MSDFVVLIRVNAFGGSERHTVELVNFLTQKSRDVTLIQSGMDLRGMGLGESRYLEVVNTSLPFRHDSANDMVRDIRANECQAWLSLLECHRAERVLVVKPWYYAVGMRLMRAIRRRFPDVITIEHSMPPLLGRPTRRLHFGVLPGLSLWWRRERRRRWRMARLVDRVVTVSSAAADSLVAETMVPRAQISVCRNGVDTAQWVRDEAAGWGFRRRYCIDERCHLFGVVARLLPIKGVDLAIEALEQLKSMTPKAVSLCVVGDGPERDDLEALSRSLGVFDQIRFTGHLDNVQVAYSAFDTLLCPSRNESFNLAAVEAMSCGCRVVAADVGGLREAVSSEVGGRLLPVREPRVWAEAMLEELERCKEGVTAMRRAIREYVEREHDQRVGFAQIERILFGSGNPNQL